MSDTDRARTQAELEATFRDVTDPSYHHPLEQAEQGWDAVTAAAATMGRASTAIQRNGQAFYLLPHSRQLDEPASGAQHASGPLLVRRTAPASAEVRIPAGKRLRGALRDSRGAAAPVPDFELGAEVVLAPGELGPVTVEAIATRPGNQANLPAGTLIGFAPEGARTVAGMIPVLGTLLEDTGIPDVFTAGDVGRYLRLAGELDARRILSYEQGTSGKGLVRVTGDNLAPDTFSAVLLEWSDLGIVVEQPEPFDNGRHAQLDAIGRERQIPRGAGEPDLDYAYRISSLPDVVSPPAIERVAAQVLSPLGIGFTLHETRESIRGFVLDATPLDAGANCDDGPWSGATLLSDTGTKRFFALCVDSDPNLASFGLPFDALNAGLNAYDVATQPGDGYARGYRDAMLTLSHAVNSARGAGVAFRVLPRRTFEPWEIEEVDVELELADTTPDYEDAAIDGLQGLFQLTPPNTPIPPWHMRLAIEHALTAAGLSTTPIVIVSPTLTLAPAPRRVYRLGGLTLI